MKLLVLFSGSYGHFDGFYRFLYKNNLDDNIIYASYFKHHKFKSNDIQYYQLKSYPCFLNVESLLAETSIALQVRLKYDQYLYKSRKNELSKLLQVVNPDIILIDNFNYTDALLIAELKINSNVTIVLYQTRLSTCLGSESKYGSFHKINFFFQKSVNILRRQKRIRTFKSLCTPGFSDYANIRKLLNRVEFNKVSLNIRRYGIPSLTYLPELILSGQDLSNYHAINQYYMGLGIHPRWNDSSIRSQKKIMVSIGSRDISDDIVSEYLKGIQALITSVNGVQYFIPEPLKSFIFGSNVTYYSWNTYHDHLVQAHLHITHGGINSIKDSLAYAVPMLICPLDWKSDQIHNALMFEKIGLAKTWNIKKDDLVDVRQKMDALLEENYPERIKEYVEEDRRKYPVEKVREEFLGLVRDEKYAIRNW